MSMVEKLNNSERERIDGASFRALFLDTSSDFITVQTSGSTGVPKKMQVQKSRMIASAKATLTFLNIQKGQSALLCLPTKYISGMMMVVRSIVGGLHLIEGDVCGHPLEAFVDQGASFDFVAMTPMQVFNSLQVPQEKMLLQQIGTLIIGGGAISPALEKELRKLHPVRIYSTYGMTETLSHIAMRQVNGEHPSSWYVPLPGVTIDTDTNDALRIFAPEIYPDWLQTNDVVHCVNQKFEVLGRRDNIINSGGVKIQLEQVEKEIAQVYSSLNFVVTSVADDKFGEVLVLLVEKGNDIDCRLSEIDFDFLPRYFQPKHMLFVEHIPMTETGKPNRPLCKQLFCEMQNNQ